MVSHVARLRARGFDLSRYDPRDQTWSVRCSGCEALVINGHPCHERGCPNEKRGD
jgi:hypothetical protein